MPIKLAMRTGIIIYTCLHTINVNKNKLSVRVYHIDPACRQPYRYHIHVIATLTRMAYWWVPKYGWPQIWLVLLTFFLQLSMQNMFGI